jgi:hypothetical protein
MHGLVRLPHLNAFADGMIKLFVDSVQTAEAQLQVFL